MNNQHAIANGLTFTPLADSVRDIHAWWYSDAVQQVVTESLLSRVLDEVPVGGSQNTDVYGPWIRLPKRQDHILLCG